MHSPYDTIQELLSRLGVKSQDVLGEATTSLLARALVDQENRLAFYVNAAGQFAASNGTVVVAGNAVVDFLTVANAAARLALTTATVRNGDHVKDTDTGHLYELVDDSAISTAGSWVKLKSLLLADLADATTVGRALAGLANPGAVRFLRINADHSVSALNAADTVAALGLTNALMVGEVRDYAGPSAPAGWLFAAGQAVSRTTYAALFGALGTIYGVGNGSTTFNLPDLRGRVVAGKDDMGSSAANRLSPPFLSGDILGAAGGTESEPLSNASHQHFYQYPTFSSTLVDANLDSLTVTALTGQGSDNSLNTSTEGEGSAHNNVQPTFILNKIIYAGA